MVLYYLCHPSEAAVSLQMCPKAGKQSRGGAARLLVLLESVSFGVRTAFSSQPALSVLVFLPGLQRVGENEK